MLPEQHAIKRIQKCFYTQCSHKQAIKYGPYTGRMLKMGSSHFDMPIISRLRGSMHERSGTGRAPVSVCRANADPRCLVRQSAGSTQPPTLPVTEIGRAVWWYICLPWDHSELRGPLEKDRPVLEKKQVEPSIIWNHNQCSHPFSSTSHSFLERCRVLLRLQDGGYILWLTVSSSLPWLCVLSKYID